LTILDPSSLLLSDERAGDAPQSRAASEGHGKRSFYPERFVCNLTPTRYSLALLCGFIDIPGRVKHLVWRKYRHDGKESVVFSPAKSDIIHDFRAVKLSVEIGIQCAWISMIVKQRQTRFFRFVAALLGLIKFRAI
jgi:hypothetical protein